MRLNEGARVPTITLPTIDGSEFQTASLAGRKYLLGFFRFASCPFCNLRLHGLVQQYESYADDFTVVAVFDSPPDNLIANAKRHRAPFPILADESNEYYRQFGIERSLLGVVKGITTRVPTLIRATLKGNIPLQTKGSMTTMPANFLIDADGIIHTAYYGNDEGDQLPFEAVAKFANEIGQERQARVTAPSFQMRPILHTSLAPRDWLHPG